MAKTEKRSLLVMAGTVIAGAILYRMGVDIYEWAKYKWKNREKTEEIVIQ